jgi:nitrogen fixation NifU-like protein
MFDDLNDLYQQVILDHSKSPRNFFKLEVANRVAEGRNPLCGDQVTVYSLVENDVVREISWQGSGCAISKASASIMTDALKGKTAGEVKELFRNFHDLTTTGASDSKDLGKLAAFGGVNKYPARVKCAILPWHAALATLDGKANIVSTE